MKDLYVRNVSVSAGSRKPSAFSTERFSGSALRAALVMLLCIICGVSGTVSFAQTVTFTTPGSDTWTVPAGVTSITIETWGGGGGGGGARTNASYVSSASAGGGGGYARTTIAVNPGDVMNIQVGAPGTAGVGGNAVLGGNNYTTTAQGAGGQGGTSSVTFGTVILQATGGEAGRGSGAGSCLVGGTGGTGTVFSGTGTATYTGGAGSRGENGGNGYVGGAGGGGAGTTGNGSAGEAFGGVGKSSAKIGGAGGTLHGGRGGNGGFTTNTETGSGGQAGSAGATIGGGGGGAVQKRGSTSRDGGAGARGEVRITYTVSCTSPAQPSAISGSATLCAGASGTYSVTNNPAATSYTWTLPSGWSGSSTSNSINATAGASGGTITVVANNACGSSTSQTFTVTSNAVPAQPSAISGSATLCAGASGTYSVTNNPAATSYTWTLPSGWSGSSTSNSINATAGASGGTITVVANNACGSSTSQTFTVTSNTAPAQPSAISGSATLCAGASGTYSVTNNPAATGYTWTLPSGWSGSSTTNSINATAGATGGTITVTANNTCGASTSQTFTVTSGAVPAQPGAITGSPSLCDGASDTYTVPNDASATGYTWTLPSGWSGSSTSNSINATAGATGGTITVTANNTCGASTSQTFTVTSGAVPAQPGAITGSPSLCDGVSDTYTVPNDASATGYTWTLPSGWSGSSTTNSINATAGATGGTITVTANNTCGASTSQTFTVSSGAVPAQPGAITGSPSLCDGVSDTYTVPNDASATGYTWTLPGSWTGSSTTNSINATAGVTGGTITVTANNTCGASTSQTFTVTSGAVPAQPGAITGSPSLCDGASDTYTVPNDASATGYTWTLPSGWSGSSTTNSINATAGATGGTITVTANNTCGASTSQTFTVTSGAVPAQPGAITGSPSLCDGVSDTYTVPNDASATGYTWTLPSGWSGSSTTNSINATAGATGGTITVTANNTCGASTSQTFTVSSGAVPAQPGAITGSPSLCDGASDTYTVPNDASATGYTWTLPSGWSGSSTTNSINATAGATGGTITVTANNTCGASTSQTFTVTSGAVPAQPGAITGSPSLCDGASDTYTVPNDASATSYTWTLPSGWSGSSTTNSINATAGASGGTITVTANNTCGASTSQTFTVSSGAVPAQPGAITGSPSLCDGASDTYTVPNDASATGYTWTLPSGWSGSSTTNSINATAGVTGGTITVTANNTCGASTSQTLTVTSGAVPAQPATITGNPSLCNGASGSYAVASDPNATGYTWTLPSGWSGSSTTNSISATAGASGGTITVTANNACGSSTSQTLAVTVNLPTSSTISDAFCTSYTLNGQTYTAAGTYTQQLTNAAGCDSTITIHLTNASPGSTIYRVACNSYTWNTQTYTQTGTYTQQFTNSGGCDSTVTLHLTINQLDLSVTQNGHILTANEHGASYQWLNCDNGNSVIVGAVGQTFTASSNGNYAVVISKNACTDTSACVQVLSASLYEIDFASLFTVYPNPSNGYYTIASSQFLYDVQLSVYSLTGQLVHNQQNLYGETLVFDISNQNTGVYILQIRSGDRVSHIRLMKQ